MPNWNEVLLEIHQTHNAGDGAALDTVRRKYLAEVNAHTGRNVIAYYSGWLQGRNLNSTQINDRDKNGFMVTIHKMDRSKGLDLILHTPGGDLAAAESIIDYLYSMFGLNIRAIIPQISMSAGTLMAMACSEIMMGKQSNLGPIDPQMGGVPCQGVLDEFARAQEDVAAAESRAALWQVIISKYHPTFLGSCKNAIDWSEKLAEEWLTRSMCAGDQEKAKKILKEFSDHNSNKSHNRHISTEKCKTLGLNIVDMEADQVLQDLILTVHHAFMHSMTNAQVSKIIENHMGIAYIEFDPPSQQT